MEEDDSMADSEPGAYIEEWLHSCIRCGTCKYQFLEYEASCPSGEHFGFETYFASGRIWLARGLQTNQIQWDDSLLQPIFACTTCGACEVQCHAPHQGHIIDIIEDLRRIAVENVGALEAHEKFRNYVEEYHNPYKAEHHSRRLVQEHNLPENADTVLFVGCTSNYRETQIRDATISVLKKAGVDFTIVDEFCCGSPLLRTGQNRIVSELMQHNADAIRSSGAKQVITSCAGCFRTLSRNYSELGLKLDVEIIHSSEMFRNLIRAGNLMIVSSAPDLKITYHDPCHLGRHMGVYEIPREVLSQLPVSVIEMKKNRDNAWCCGAGGGAKSAYEEMAISTGKARIQQAMETGAQKIVSACPFCTRNLRDAAGSDEIDVIDLAELVDELTVGRKPLSQSP
jgi:Fe-S oxidoreductase